MAKKGLDISAFAKGLNLGNVSDSDRGREHIEYIDIDLLDGDEKNFYGIEGINELAANIQLCGLQQPLRVRPGENGRFRIVSGHRRKAALLELIGDGYEQFRKVPCIREQAAESDALQEIRLIFANSDTRNLSSYEKNQQTKRVEELLYQMKLDGYEFEGRLRDIAARICKVSATKAANLKVIREHLIPEFSKIYQKTGISEDTALNLARLPAEDQKKIFETYSSKKSGLHYFYAWEAKECGEQLKQLKNLPCKKEGGFCTNADRKFQHLHGAAYCYDHCETKCCGKCEKLASCKMACPLFSEKIKQLKADAKAQKQHDAEVQEEADRPYLELITAIWAREAEARQLSGKTVKEVCNGCSRYYTKDTTDTEWTASERGEKLKKDSKIPYVPYWGADDMQRLIRAADFFEVSLDYLLCRTDEPALVTSPPAPAGDLWHPLDAEHWPQLDQLVILSAETQLGGRTYALARCIGNSADSCPFSEADDPTEALWEWKYDHYDRWMAITEPET